MTALVLRKGFSSHQHLLPYSADTVYNWILFCLLLISVCWLHSSSALGVWKFDAPDDSLAQMTVNPKTGDVFVAGQSVLYQLTRNLQTKRTYNLRTEPDLRRQTKSDRRARNDAGTLLEIDSNGDLLLHCENAVRSMCSVFLAENLSHVGQLAFSSSPGNRTESNRALVGTFGSDDSHRGFVLFIASSFDRNLSNKSAEIVQIKWERSPVSFASFKQKIGFDANGRGTGHQKTFEVQYLYAFENNNFVYFLTVQQDSTLESFSYETRLARVCKDDHNFVSYTEITLICGQNSISSIFYNIAVTAHKAPAGEEYNSKFHLSPNSSALYVVFGKSLEYSSDINDEVGYGLCVYPMHGIEDFFARAQRECYEGLGRLLEWINHDVPQCSTDISQATKIENKFCGDIKNVGIGSRYPFLTESRITIYDHIPTALLVTTFQEKTIAILGTAGGHLLKYMIDGINSGPYANLSPVGDQSIAADMAFHIGGKHVYVLTPSKVSGIPVQSCSIYVTCAACVTTLDPLDCGWCDDHCTTKETCHSLVSWSKTICPPVLETFHPRSGPVIGGTRLTIFGRNFGNGTRLPGGSSTVTVVVGGSMCSIEFHDATCIICQTGSALMMKAQEKGVKVTVNDISKSTEPFQISGSSSSGSLLFSYQIPVISSFHPTVGPMSGGTVLTILGSYLDIGSAHLVTVAHQNCAVERISSLEILCLTPAFNLNSEHLHESGIFAGGPVNVSIDSAMLGISDVVYTYKDDPVITLLYPQRSIFSGGMSITVIGENLDIVQRPRIVAHPADGLSYFENCSSYADGKVMVCLSPDITDAVSQPLTDEQLHVHLEFLMDGAKNVINASLSDFIYVVNPDIDSFYGKDKIHVFYMDENYLEIMGRNLDSVATSSDYQVTIGNTKCHITQLTSVLLLCQPDKANVLHGMESLKEVKVFVGRLVFCIGFLQFSERRKDSFTTLTGALIMGSAAILVVFLFFCLVHKLWWKKRFLDFRNSYRRQAINHFEANISQDDGRVVDLPDTNLLQGNRNVHQNSEETLDDSFWLSIEARDILIPKELITIKNIIGQGHFGCVHRGILQSTATKSDIEVAIKTMKINQESAVRNILAVRKFYEEALLMKDFDHIHVLRLIGVVRGDDSLPLVVLPFMQNGDLLTYIRCGENAPTVRDLMEFGIQVAEGMAYLSNLKYVHRDLAARNCMLDEQMQIKVADFGLSRDVYEREYYSCDNRQSKLPVKWMAMESLEKGIYNSKTDVWSYGIVLWELLTRGVTPYPEVDNWDVVTYLKSGRRLPQPAYAPGDLYSLMLICWHPIANVRPAFDGLVIEIRNIIRSLESSNRAVELNRSSYAKADTEETYLNPRSTRSTGGETSAQESDLLLFAGFLDTAV